MIKPILEHNNMGRIASSFENMVLSSIEQITDVKKLDHLIGSLGEMAEMPLYLDGFPSEFTEDYKVKTLSYGKSVLQEISR